MKHPLLLSELGILLVFEFSKFSAPDGLEICLRKPANFCLMDGILITNELPNEICGRKL